MTSWRYFDRGGFVGQKVLRQVFVVALGVLGLIHPSIADNYGKAILSDQPTGYWRLNDTSGTIATDSSAGGANPGVYQSNTSSYSMGQGGFLPFAGNKAVHFNGGSVYGPYDANSAILSASYAPALQPFAYANNFTIEAWIRDSSPLPV